MTHEWKTWYLIPPSNPAYPLVYLEHQNTLWWSHIPKKITAIYKIPNIALLNTLPTLFRIIVIHAEDKLYSH